MLRRLLDDGAGDEELSEEIRAFVEHDVESKIVPCERLSASSSQSACASCIADCKRLFQQPADSARL
jgi:hypothetical protein